MESDPGVTTYISFVGWLTAMPSGPLPTVIVEITVLVTPLIIETVLEELFVTYISFVLGSLKIASGPLPTVIVEITVLVTPLIIETVLEL